MERINVILSTINVILILIGYQLLTVLLGESLGDEGESQAITIPFRAFCLLISFIVIFFNNKRTNPSNKHIRVLVIFWVFLLVRFALDMFIIYPGILSSAKQIQLWLYMIGLTLIPMYSIWKSFEVIDLDLLFVFLFIVSSFISIFLYFTVDEFRIANADRLSLAGLNSISIGYCGLMSIVLGLYNAIIRKSKFIFKIFSLMMVGVGALVLLRAGSRGPLLSLVLTFVLFLITRSKHAVRNLAVMFIVMLLGYMLFDYFMELIEQISPVLHRRLTREEGQLNDRLPLYDAAWKGFLNNPLLGDSFAIYHDRTYSYAHNIFLDSIMQLGVIGLGFISTTYFAGIKMVIEFLKSNTSLVWIGFLLFKSMMEMMVSGSIYTNPEFSVLFVFSALLYMNKKTNFNVIRK